MSALRQVRGPRASALFPVLAYAGAEGLFLLDDASLAFGFLCEPLAAGDQGQAERLSVLLNQDWPKDALLQVMLWASPDIEEPLARMRGLRIEHADPLLREASTQRAEFLRRGTGAALGPGTELRVRDLQVLVTVKLPIAAAVPTQSELRDAAELRVGTGQVLATAGLEPQGLSADRYVRLLQVLLNWGEGAGWRDRIIPECDPGRLVREQLLDLDHAIGVDARGLTLGDCRVQTLSVKRFPDRVAFGMAARFLGDPLSGTRGIRHNVLVCLNLHFPEPESARVRLTAERQWAANMAYGPLVKFLPSLAQRKHGFDVLFEALDNGDRPLRAYLGVVLFTPPEEAVAALSNLRTYWRELGFQLMADRFFALPLFLHCLPFGPDRQALRDTMRYRTLAATQAVTLMPVFGDWKGTGTPVLNLVARSGQLMALSLFDSASNYNAVIAAQSGSGKSFLTNELLATNLSVGGRCWVIDVGRSYENLCASLEGQFVAFTREATLCLNPFELIRNWEEEADVITALVTAMAAPTEPLGRLPHRGAETCPCSALWDAKGAAMSWTTCAEVLLADRDRRVRDVGQQLYPFTSAGGVRALLQRPQHHRLWRRAGGPGARGAQRAQAPPAGDPAPAHLPDSAGDVSGRARPPKLVLIDEAWDLLTQGDVATLHRAPATGAFASTTGRPSPSPSPSPTSTATPPVARSPTTAPTPCCWRNRAHAIEQLKAEHRLPMSDGGAELLKTVHTVPGVYSEILILTDAVRASDG